MNSILAWQFSGALIATYIFCHGMRAWAQHRDHLDVPNHRSAHTMPTPTSAGLAMVIVFAVAIAWLGIWGEVVADLVIAFMGFADIPLDMTTLLIGGVVIGLAVDDTIHFMHKFNRYYEDTGDPGAAVHETLMTTGSALLFTSLVLGLGFSIFMGSLRGAVGLDEILCRGSSQLT